jgi:DNA-binding transcriptional regulator YiaG
MDEQKPQTRHRGRPAKAEERQQTEQTKRKDAEVFKAAAEWLNLTATHDAEKFGVSRQTLSKWMKGETAAPRSAFVLLLDEVLKANNIAPSPSPLGAKLNRVIDERIAAALKLMEQTRRADQPPHPDGRKD